MSIGRGILSRGGQIPCMLMKVVSILQVNSNQQPNYIESQRR